MLLYSFERFEYLIAKSDAESGLLMLVVADGFLQFSFGG